MQIEQPADTTAEKKYSNIVKFPEKKFSFSSIEALEELKEQVKASKLEFVDYLSTELVEEMFFKIAGMGFDIANDEYAKDNVMILESVKSLLLKTMGIEHKMQEAAEKLIAISDENGEFSD
jgi:hypothetical protein